MNAAVKNRQQTQSRAGKARRTKLINWVLAAPEQSAVVSTGTVYRRGSVVVAKWTHDVLGRVITGDGRETWELPNTEHYRQQAAENFAAIVGRNEDADADAAAERAERLAAAEARCVADAGDRF